MKVSSTKKINHIIFNMNISTGSLHIPSLFVITLSFFVMASCKGITSSSDVEDSLEPIEEVSFIDGTESTVLNVNRSSHYFFSLEFQNVGNNNIITNGVNEGWCIDWQKPIDSNGGVYNDIRLYSTFLVEKWNPVNFLLNIKEQLKETDPDITFREIQLAIWSLRGFPEFNLDDIELSDLPSRMLVNGQPAFNKEKVKQILEIVEEGYRDFEFTEGTYFAVIAETPADVQTVITVAR